MTSYKELRESPMPPGRCNGCEYVKEVCATSQWSFYGCYHEPCKKKGIRRAEVTTPCIGYAKSDYDDEPCEMCKNCVNCESYDGGSEERAEKFCLSQD